MSTTSDTDYQFMLCCLKHSQGRPDFHAIAKELGLRTHMTAYHRHWKIMKRAGMAGNTGKGRKAGKGAAGPNYEGSGSQKRGRQAKATPKAYDEESDEDLDLDLDQENNCKPEPEDESDEADDRLLKKTKIDQVEEREAAKDEFAQISGAEVF